jgi:hypothetical protein
MPLYRHPHLCWLFQGFADQDVDVLRPFWSPLRISRFSLAKLSVLRRFSEADLIGIISRERSFFLGISQTNLFPGKGS